MGPQIPKRFAGILTHPLRLFLGYCFFLAWIMLLYSSGVLLVSPNNLLPLSLVHLSSSGSVIATSALMALLATRLTPLSHRRELLYLIAALGALATAGIVMVSASVLSANWMFVCVAFTGFSGAWLQMAWFEHLATQGVRGTLACLGITAVLGTLLQVGISLVPQEVGIVLTCLLPILSLVCLRPLQSNRLVSYGSTTADPAAVPAKDNDGFPTNSLRPKASLAKRPTFGQLFRQIPIALTLTVGIVYFSMGAIRTLQLPVDPTTIVMSDMFFGLAANIVSIGIALAIALYSYRMNTALAFYIAIPFIIIASLLIAIPNSLPIGLPQTAVSIGTELIRLLVFSLFIELSITKRIPAIFLFALLSCVQFAGTLLGQLFAVVIAGNTLTIALVVMIALVLAMLALVAARSSLSSEGIARQAPASTAHAVLLDDIAQTAALTPREFEVLQIWISGHNSAHIEEQLHISKNTVKTHLNHIYAKTGTANREELLVLLEAQASAQKPVDKTGL
jgi:DNA-binding CsgD family transcriptional regulator